MWERKEVKARGKKAMKANYWKSVLVALIFTLLCGGGFNGFSTVGKVVIKLNQNPIGAISNVVDPDKESGFEEGNLNDLDGYLSDDDYLDDEDDFFTKPVSKDTLEQYFGNLDTEDLIMALFFLIPVLIVGIALGAVIAAFLLNPLEVGADRFFVDNLETSASVGALGRGFESHYMTNVTTMLIMNIKVFLWSLLFIIPGVIKAYEYRMIPYILADHDDISRKEAFDLSKQMMDGNKMRAFIFDLSFIGWHILGAITLGLAELLYVQPYYLNACAALYDELKPEDRFIVDDRYQTADYNM